MQAVLEKVKHDLELAECTFQPKITSPINATKSGQDNPVEQVVPIHERLFHEDTERIKENQRKREELKKQMEIEGATFAPVIPTTSKSLASGILSHLYDIILFDVIYAAKLILTIIYPYNSLLYRCKYVYIMVITST